METNKMDAIIYAMWDHKIGRDWYKDDEAGKLGCLKYVRMDLVDQLIGYAVHDDDCRWCFPGDHDGHGPCTCGLSDKIREVRGE